MTIVIDEYRAVALIEQVVQGNEDFVYKAPYGDTCLYVREGKPDCLIAQALFAAGVPLSVIVRLDRCDSILSPQIHQRLANAGVQISDEAYSTFYAAQHAQDSENSWGEALRQAKNRLSYIETGVL